MPNRAADRMAQAERDLEQARSSQATPYVNGHPEGAPFEHCGSIQSEEAIGYAGEILDFVCSQMA